MRTKTNQPTAISIAILSAACLVLITLAANERRVTAQQRTQQPAQQPRTAEQAFKNIKVIKSMPAGQLQSAMSFISASLGVDCSYCHTLPAMEKDEKPTKETARRCLAMVSEINKNFGDKTVVNCTTCHRGKPKPASVPPLQSLSSPFAANRASVSQQPLPAVDEILDRYIKALGGMKALDKVTTRVRKGSVEVAGLHGTFELYEVAPNKSVLSGSLPPPLGSLQQAFDGSSGWVKNRSGVFDMSGEGLAQAQRESAMYRDVKLKDQFKLMSVAGRERIDTREFYVVLGTRSDEQLERLYFDVQTGLLARRYWETPTYFGTLPNANDYDDYRKVGSVRLPFVIRRTRGGNSFLQTISEYKLNVTVDEVRFKKPVVQK
jgi:photosynthetic reaction center cytochrome c subunit